MAETSEKRITLSNFFEQIVEVNKVANKALKQSNESVSISEKNKLDLERLIQTLKVTFDRDQESTKSEVSQQISNVNNIINQKNEQITNIIRENKEIGGKVSSITRENKEISGKVSSITRENKEIGGKVSSIIREDEVEDRELKDSFSLLQKSFNSLSSAIGIIRSDLDSLSNAFLQMQQGRRRMLGEQNRQISKQEDTLQKSQILGKGGGQQTQQTQNLQNQQQAENKTLSTLKQFLGGGLLAGLGLGLGNLGGAPGSDDESFVPTSGRAPVADISKDIEFQKEVQALAKETGAKPSELMAMYNAEGGGIDPKSKNPKSGATGIFQLMFNRSDPTSKRYGYTREEFTRLSRADQVKIHRQYLKDKNVGPGGHQGIQSIHAANIAPAYLGQPPNTVIYKSPSAEYEGNKNVDLVYGNKDGQITLQEFTNFINKRGDPKQFEKYDKPIPSSSVQPAGGGMGGRRGSGSNPSVSSQLTEPGSGTYASTSSQIAQDTILEPMQNGKRVPPLRVEEPSITSITLPTIDAGTQQVGGGQGRGQPRTNSYSVASAKNSMLFARVLTASFSDKMNIVVG